MHDPFQITRDFEAALCEYTGAPYAVVVNSCTMAILIAAAYLRQHGQYSMWVSVPRLTYIGVPHALIEAGFDVEFRDENWQGEHQIAPLPLYDAARRFTGGMYQNTLKTTQLGSIFQCVSFHNTKVLSDSQGGAILHGDSRADAWLRRARFDGRTEGASIADGPVHRGRAWHAYISPSVSAALLWKLSSLPRQNADLPRSDYPDLSLRPEFRDGFQRSWGGICHI